LKFFDIQKGVKMRWDSESLMAEEISTEKNWQKERIFRIWPSMQMDESQ
jgi:hypothetical protein